MRVFSILAFLFLALWVNGQDNLFSAIGKADVTALSQRFGGDIEVCIGTDQDFYSKAGAVKKLEQFFNKVQPKDSSFKHKGSNKDKTSEYAVGTMNSNDGIYRVFLYFEGEKITGVHFNKE